MIFVWNTSSVVDPGIIGCFGHYHQTPSPQGGPAEADQIPGSVLLLFNWSQLGE